MRAATIIAALCCAVAAAPSHAEDVTGLMRTKPVFTVSTDRRMYDLERCMIGVDAPVMPFVYRQPDRPDQALFVWDGNGGGLGGVAAAARIDGVEHATLTFWGREKILRRIKPCVGLPDPG